MQRLTISVNKQLALSFDELIKRKGYRNRSEAFRHLLRKTMQQEPPVIRGSLDCVGCLSYTYDKHQPKLVHRIAELKQRFVNITVSSTLATIDGSVCMETLILRGTFDEVASLADAIAAEPSVNGSHLNCLPLAAPTDLDSPLLA